MQYLDLLPQIAVKDSGATQGFDATSKFRVQNSVTYLDLHLGHIMKKKKRSLFL